MSGKTAALNPNREEASYALEKPVDKGISTGYQSSRHGLQRLAPRRLRLGQRGDAFVKRGEHAAPTEGKPQQIRIG